LLKYKRHGKLATLVRNSNSINIYSLKSINNSQNASILEDENAPVQVSIDKMSRKFSFPNSLQNPLLTSQISRENSSGGVMTKSINSSVPISQPSSHVNYLTHFSWYNFDSNKILVSSNSINNISTLSLSDTFVLVGFFAFGKNFAIKSYVLYYAHSSTLDMVSQW
jgi:hypothetical protein